MAVTVHEGGKAVQKKLGAEIGGRGAEFPSFSRLPTGIMSLDVALGGGIPEGCVSIVYGAESSGKTSLTLRLMAQFQKRNPDKAAVWIDAENSWDADWASKHGVKVDEVYLYKPSTVEEAGDIIQQIGPAEDCGFLAVDSVAALASRAQIDKHVEEVVMGGAAKEVARALQKINTAQVDHAKRGTKLTSILINQIRHKIGFVMGNPETLPGPSYQNFLAYLKLRLKGKPILDQKVAPIPVYAQNSATITKKKFPVCALAAEWNTILYPYEGWVPLDVNNAKITEKILTEIGALTKEGSGFALWGEAFDTKKAAVAAAVANYDVTLESVVDDILSNQGSGT